ncbi:MAG: hypothetical protein V3U62_01360, partial [Sedimenticolaceae bacterium]
RSLRTSDGIKISPGQAFKVVQQNFFPQWMGVTESRLIQNFFWVYDELSAKISRYFCSFAGR